MDYLSYTNNPNKQFGISISIDTFISCIDYSITSRVTDFSGILTNQEFSKTIQKSFANQGITLARTVESNKKILTFQCTFCQTDMQEIMGEYDCSHCGALMQEKSEKEDEV